MSLDMHTIRELESEFGKLANVPDNHPKLKKFRPKPKEKTKPKKKENAVMPSENNAGKLNDMLFEQMNRLNREDMTKEELKDEINRSKANTQLATQIINNGRLALDAQKFSDNRASADSRVPKMLEE